MGDWTQVQFTKQETARALTVITFPYRHRHTAAAANQSPVQVHYFYKPPTKYPARIYLLYGDWPERNRRSAGISKQPCLYVRAIGLIEREEINDCARMMSGQFEAGEVNHMIFRHMDDGLTDDQIQKMLDAVLPHCDAAFRQHEPINEIRARFDAARSSPKAK